MDIAALQSFVEVCRTGSFRGAARSRSLTQPGVTRHVQRLERELGTTLLYRGHRETSATPLGKRLLVYAQDAIERHNKLLASFMQGYPETISGEVRIAASTTPGESLLPGLLSEFTETYPFVRPEVFVADSTLVAQEVQEGKWEIGFVGAKSGSRGLTYDVIGEDEIMLAVPERHRFAGRPSIALKEMEDLPFIEREDGSGTFGAFQSAVIAAGEPYPRYRPVMVLNSTHAILSAVNNGFGFGLVSSLALEDHGFEHVYRARITDLPLRRKIYLVRRQRSVFSPAARAFADWVLARLAPDAGAQN